MAIMFHNKNRMGISCINFSASFSEIPPRLILLPVKQDDIDSERGNIMKTRIHLRERAENESFERGIGKEKVETLKKRREGLS